MAAQVKRVCYFETWQNRVAEEMLRAAGDFDIVRLEYATEASENFQAMSGCHGYYVSSARHETPAAYHVTRDLLARCPNMLVVCTSGAGYDTLDLKACTEAGVLAVHQAGANREAVAEHALAMLLGLAKRLVEADRRLRRERNFTRSDLMGHNIQGKTLGIVGLGFVGTRMAELCRGLFGMRVIAHDPYVSDADFATRGAGRVPLDQLVREADVVSIHCPLTDETHGLMNAERFQAMKPGSWFVTTARGSIHDEKALEAALKDGRLAGAGIDVWDIEPPPLDHPLLSYDNVIVSPHTAGVTHESRYDIAVMAADQLIDVFQGRRPGVRLLNPEVWDRYAERFARAFGRPPSAGPARW